MISKFQIITIRGRQEWYSGTHGYPANFQKSLVPLGTRYQENFRCWVLCRPLITISEKFVFERDLRLRGGFGMGFFGDPFPGHGGREFFSLGQKATFV